MKVAGMSMSKQVVSDKAAYAVQQGQRKDYTAEEFKEKKENAAAFPELAYAKRADLKIKGIETINGSDAYAIENGKTTLYYDVKTGLKVGEAKTMERAGQKMTQMVSYSDYKEVKGIKVPYKTIMNVGMDLDFTTSDVKINEGVTAADFQ